MSPLSSAPSPSSTSQVDDSLAVPEISASYLAAAAALISFGAVAFLVNSLIRNLQLPGMNAGLAVAAVVMAAIAIFARRGKVRLATNLLALAGPLLILWIAYSTGGVHAPIMALFPVLVFYAGWRFGTRGAKLTAVLAGTALTRQFRAEEIEQLTGDSTGLLRLDIWDALKSHVETAERRFLLGAEDLPRMLATMGVDRRPGAGP